MAKFLSKKELREKNSFITQIGQVQTMGPVNVNGSGGTRLEDLPPPYRILDGAPVYVSTENEFTLGTPDFPERRMHKWGQYSHPYMLLPDTPGENKVYVDTRFKDWYVMIVASKVNEYDIGPSDWSYGIVAWTPKLPNDNWIKAGYRMFAGACFAMDYVPIDQFHTADFEEAYRYEVNWLYEWDCTLRCRHVFCAYRNFWTPQEESYQRFLEAAPDWLKEHIAAHKGVPEPHFRNLRWYNFLMYEGDLVRDSE